MFLAPAVQLGAHDFYEAPQLVAKVAAHLRVGGEFVRKLSQEFGFCVVKLCELDQAVLESLAYKRCGAELGPEFAAEMRRVWDMGAKWLLDLLRERAEMIAQLVLLGCGGSAMRNLVYYTLRLENSLETTMQIESLAPAVVLRGQMAKCAVIVRLFANRGVIL